MIKASGRVLTTTIEVAYDDSAPQISGFTLNTTSLPLSHFEGSELFYGTQTSGTMVASFQASDTTGVREVNFPALFQSGAETVPGGGGATVYTKTYPVDGVSDTTAGNFSFTVVDRVGNTSTQAVTIVKDTTPPAVDFKMTTSVPLEYTATWQPTEAESGIASYTVEGCNTIPDPDQCYTLTLDGDQTLLDMTGGVGGINQLKITAVDRVGNVSAVEPWTASVWQAKTKYYTFGGQAVAVRHAEKTDPGNPLDEGVVSYLVTDHLNSTSLVLDSSGGVVAQTRYYPFGGERWSDGVEPTEKSFTGQRREGFGLLDFNARFYDPHLGRFIQPDTLSQIGLNGSGNSFALTVYYSKLELLERYNSINQTPFSITYTVQTPLAPQNLDRYAYVVNNPLKYIDATGHCIGVAGGLDTIACMALVPLGPPGWIVAGVITVVVIAGVIAADDYLLSQRTGPRPLLPDEREHVERATDLINDWLANHGDISSEAERIRNGEDWTQWKYCHVCEAWDKVRELERTINTLEKVKLANRTEEGLAEVERALENAREKLKHLEEILKGTEKADKNRPEN